MFSATWPGKYGWQFYCWKPFQQYDIRLVMYCILSISAILLQLIVLYWHPFVPVLQESVNKTQVRNDSRGAPEARRGGVQHWSPLSTHTVSQKQHTGAHQLSQQQEAAWKSQSLWQVSGLIISLINIWLYRVTLYLFQVYRTIAQFTQLLTNKAVSITLLPSGVYQ